MLEPRFQRPVQFSDPRLRGTLFSMPDGAPCGLGEKVLFASCDTWTDSIDPRDKAASLRIVNALVKTIVEGREAFGKGNSTERPPSVALLSYRTAKAGAPPSSESYARVMDVAHKVARERYPEMGFSGEGCLQFDAALIPEIYASKVKVDWRTDRLPPDIFIFPTKTSYEIGVAVLDFALARRGEAAEARSAAEAYIRELEGKARSRRARIVMPEATSPEVLGAVAMYLRNEVGPVVLLGRESEIRAVAAAGGIDVSGAEVVAPEARLLEAGGSVKPEVLDRYTPLYCDALRQARTPENLRSARTVLSMFFKNKSLRNLFLGAAMVAHGEEAQCMAAGKVYDSKDFMLAAKMLIGTRDEGGTISGDYLMCHPGVGTEGRLFVSDVASEVCPDATQLAAIAMNTVRDVEAYIDPTGAKLAFIFASDGESEKVRAAVRTMREALGDSAVVDGPVVFEKALAEGYNAIVLPDISCANLAYKALQRIGGFTGLAIVSGGVGKPVLDISRGADSDEIYTSMVLSTCGVGRG